MRRGVVLHLLAHREVVVAHGRLRRVADPMAPTKRRERGIRDRAACGDQLFVHTDQIAAALLEQLDLPPLRARPGDIPLLVNYYVDTFNTEFRKHLRGVEPDAMAALKAYGWPGNVRELRNIVERAMLLAEGPTLTVGDVPAASAGAVRLTEQVALPAAGFDLEQLERSLVVQALERSGWNQTKAAGMLGLNRVQIRYRVEKFKLEKPS
jgi:DNA-binding NtrC family response regulator